MANIFFWIFEHPANILVNYQIKAVNSAIFLKFLFASNFNQKFMEIKTLSCQLKFIVGTLGNSLMQKKNMPSKFDNLCKVPLHVF